MSSEHEGSEKNIPYKLSLGGVTPTDAAWLHVSFLPKDLFRKLLETYEGASPNQWPEEFWKSPSEISMQMCGWSEATAQALVKANAERLAPHQSAIDRLKGYALRRGTEPAEAEHTANIFALGIAVGAMANAMTNEYAADGIRDIESET